MNEPNKNNAVSGLGINPDFVAGVSNEIALNALVSMFPGEVEKDLTKRILRVLLKHGIPLDKAWPLFLDMLAVFNDGGDKK